MAEGQGADQRGVTAPDGDADRSGPAQPAPGRPVRRFAGAALAAAALAAAVNLVLVQSPSGQAIENLALAGAQLRDQTELDDSLTSLSQISLATFAGAIVVIVLIAIARRRSRLALLVGGVMVASVAVAEVLKLVLPRPHLVTAPSWLLPNTFPSGHAAVAVAIAVGLLLVTPDRLRWVSLPVAAVYSAVIAQAVQIAGWHRLSGTLGAALVVVAVVCGALALFAVRGLVLPTDRGAVNRRIMVGLVVSAGLAIGVGAIVAVLPLALPVLVTPRGSLGAFAHAALNLLGVGSTMLVVVLFGALLSPYTLDHVDAGDRGGGREPGRRRAVEGERP